MKVYEATVIDKCAGAEPVSYESYVAVLKPEEIREDPDDLPIADEDIHYYFTEDEFAPNDGEIETEEFKYLIGKMVE